jgi:hypothetical protein
LSPSATILRICSTTFLGLGAEDELGRGYYRRGADKEPRATETDTARRAFGRLRGAVLLALAPSTREDTESWADCVCETKAADAGAAMNPMLIRSLAG